jgi:predicted flap endonuclease-1-like 5' DNA nuclease
VTAISGHMRQSQFNPIKEDRMRVQEVRGMEATLAEKLVARGIKTADDLLKAGKTSAARRELSAQLGVDEKALLELLNRADLARVKGIGEVYSNLLENAGVDTVAELARRVPENLHAKLVEQAQKGDARRAPTLKQVQDWVKQAKELGRGIEY